MLNQTGAPDHSLESSEELDLQLELLHSSEFERDTMRSAQGAQPQKISRKEGQTHVDRREKGGTSYDENGRIFCSIPEVNEDQIVLDTRMKPDLVQGYIRDFHEANKSSVSGDNVYEGVKGYLQITDPSGPAAMFPDELKPMIDQNFLESFSGDGRRYTDSFWKEYVHMARQGKFIFVDNILASNIDLSRRDHFKDLGESANGVKLRFEVPHLKKSIQLEKQTGMGGGRNIKILDWSRQNVSAWHEVKKSLPESITEVVTGLGIDYKGNFILVATGNVLRILDMHKDPMVEVGQISNPEGDFEGHIYSSEDGTILVGDTSGNLRKIITNLHTIPSHEERENNAKMLQRLLARERVKSNGNGAENGATEAKRLTGQLKALAGKIESDFASEIANAHSSKDIARIRRDIAAEKQSYSADITDTATLNSIFKPVSDSLKVREAEIITQTLDREVQQIRSAIDSGIDSLSIDRLVGFQNKAEQLRAGVLSVSGLDPRLKQEIVDLCDDFAAQSEEILHSQEDALIDRVDQIFEDEMTKLNGFTKHSEFEIWASEQYPAFLDALSNQLRIAPVSHSRLAQKCRDTETRIREEKAKFAKKFEEKYEQAREKAATRIDLIIDLAKTRTLEFLETLESEVNKGHFSDTEEAKAWVERSHLHTLAMDSIDDVETHDPDKADSLGQDLKVEISQLVYKVKQQKESGVEEETGRQMVHFGKEAFPVWEAKVEEKRPVKLDLIYKIEPSSKGPGIAPGDYMCELFYKLTDSKGKVHEFPVREEDMRKVGFYNPEILDSSYLGTYMPVKKAQKLMSTVKAMSSSRSSKVKREYEDFRTKIEKMSEGIAQEKKQNGNWDALREERDQLTSDYIQFLDDSGLYAWMWFKRAQKNYSNVEYANGSTKQGYIPEWSSYWVVDAATENTLEAFAHRAKMSLSLKEGAVSLEGHAGTGKDVTVEMFCNRTKRPLFTFDCSKWTTEFDLSQDVSLAAEDGASYTVKEDSAVVKALETPGAVLYFNEFNAMPLPAQIFLHSLLDQKRRLTLKTSSGRIVKAHPSVIICLSQNPTDPGTNDPQFATKRRLIPIQVNYPEFKRDNGTYSSAEALRAARSVKSLQDLTYDPNLEDNEFVQLWDQYINKSNVSDPRLTPERKFDLEVLFALITFGNNIRQAFFDKVGKKSGRKTFTISQPFTASEIRRCVYDLGKMDSSSKSDIDSAETVAKDLIRKFYSPYIFDEKEAEALEHNLTTWTTQKPSNP